MAKIVQFDDGRYGIRTKWGLFEGWYFLSDCCEYEFSSEENICRYCKLKTLEQAVTTLSAWKLRKKRCSKRHRVITPQPTSSSGS